VATVPIISARVDHGPSAPKNRLQPPTEKQYRAGQHGEPMQHRALEAAAAGYRKERGDARERQAPELQRWEGRTAQRVGTYDYACQEFSDDRRLFEPAFRNAPQTARSQYDNRDLEGQSCGFVHGRSSRRRVMITSVPSALAPSTPTAIWRDPSSP